MSKGTIHVMIAHIDGYAVLVSGNTMIKLSGGGFYVVKETPDEIDAMIEKATGSSL
jgi:hypothetical protein